jgi:hypothetical protein
VKSKLSLVAFFSVFLLAGVGFKAKQLAPRALPCAGDCVPRAQLVRSQRRSYHRLLGWRRMERRRNALRTMLAYKPSVYEAISLASIIYRVPRSTLVRRGLCESHLQRYAQNASGATSYWQFLPSTWASTPFAAFSIYSPFAQAFAAGWMMGPAGRGGEWQCR